GGHGRLRDRHGTALGSGGRDQRLPHQRGGGAGRTHAAAAGREALADHRRVHGGRRGGRRIRGDHDVEHAVDGRRRHRNPTGPGGLHSDTGVVGGQGGAVVATRVA